MMLISVVDFPAPLAPINVTISPFLHPKGDSMKGLNRTIAYVQIFNGQKHQSISFPR